MRYAVCARCRGNGTIVNPSIDGHGISADEMNELGPDFLEDYLGGVYDVRCPECKGERVVQACWACDEAVEPGYWYNEFDDEPATFTACFAHLNAMERESRDELSAMYAMEEAERRAGA